MQACERHNTPPHAEKGDIARPSGDLSEGECVSCLEFLLLKGQRRGRYGLFSGLIAIKVGLGTLAIWKTG